MKNRVNTKKQLATAAILLLLTALGVLYWLDLYYFTSLQTGFVTKGPVWLRYIMLLPPLGLAALGVRTVSAHSIGVMRVKHPVLGGFFVAAGCMGLLTGGANIAAGIQPLSALPLANGLLFIWYGTWMFLAARQMFTQKNPAPTSSAFAGVAAAFPLCLQTVFRVLTKPTSLHRTAPLIHILSALSAMLWFAVLLRALYIAMPRSRVRWLYFFGLVTFLFCSCLGFAGAAYTAMQRTYSVIELFETLNLAVLGVVAAGVSLAIAGLTPTAHSKTAAIKKEKPPVP